MAASSVESAEEIASHCRRVAGDKVRVITHYSQSEHNIVYSREDVSKQLDMDEETRSMFRWPFSQVGVATTQVSRLSPTLSAPESLTIEFGDVVALMFLITGEEGIFVTLDSPGDLTEEIRSTAKEILEIG